jgi:hypothetical protein
MFVLPGSPRICILVTAGCELFGFSRQPSVVNCQSSIFNLPAIFLVQKAATCENWGLFPRTFAGERYFFSKTGLIVVIIV